MRQSLNLRINKELHGDWVEFAPGRGCLAIDDFLANPGDLVDYAVARRSDFIRRDRGHSGEILPLGPGEIDILHSFIRSRLNRPFGFFRGDIHFQTRLSLTTLQPDDFSWFHCLPHCDPKQDAGRATIAVVLYLFDDPGLGGTGFYRWKDEALGQEMSARQQQNPAAGLDELEERFETFSKPWSYPAGSNGVVDLLHHAPARYNRLLCYSGDIPHSAYIEDAKRLTGDPRSGRLTLHSFASVWPRS